MVLKAYSAQPVDPSAAPEFYHMVEGLVARAGLPMPKLYILPNKLLWYIAFANIFVYLLRYGILDLAPTYLKEVKAFSLSKSS